MNKYFAESEAGLFKKALAAGIKIAYGTDIGGYDWQLPQARDFQYLVQYGMSPLQAIQTASINAADLLGMTGKIGEIKKGAFADLVAVAGNPLKDVKTLEAVKWVMKDGQVKK
jgi:imidazolonepropionase-like amidohydrolase